ncbi:hypothetical protein D3C80_1502820 [compost metagenome]
MPSVIRLAKPASVAIIANEEMKVGTMKRFLSQPLKIPMPAPNANVSTKARITAHAPGSNAPPDIQDTSHATRHDEAATIEPTERSISPTMISSVTPNAIIPDTAMVRRILS